MAGVSSPQIWLAGNPGPAPSPAAVIFTVILFVVVFGAFAIGTLPRRRHEAPLRKELRAAPAVTFRARVQVKSSVVGVRMAARGSLDLIVSGDAFRVFHPFPLGRWMFGQDWSYRATEVTIEMLPGLRHDWIEIDGPPRAGARIQIGSRDRNRQIWSALLGAGARPIGPPPPP